MAADSWSAIYIEISWPGELYRYVGDVDEHGEGMIQASKAGQVDSGGIAIGKERSWRRYVYTAQWAKPRGRAFDLGKLKTGTWSEVKSGALLKRLFD